MNPEPGWYPDPSDPQRARWWDGQQWAPAGQEPKGATSSKTGLWVALGVLVVVIVLVILMITGNSIPGLGGGARPDTQSARPTGSVWDETVPTDTPSETGPGDLGETVECPRVDDERISTNQHDLIVGGGVSFERPDGWDEIRFQWSGTLTDQGGMERGIPGTTWYSVLTVGQAPAEAGFTDPRITARQNLDCYVTSAIYPGLTDRHYLHDEAITVDGHQGWWIQVDAFSTEAPGGGSTFDFVVLDIGDPNGLAVFLGEAVWADEQAATDVAAARDSLRVG